MAYALKTTRGSITKPQESYIKSLRANLSDEQVEAITGMSPLDLSCKMGYLSMAEASRIIDEMKVAGRKPQATQTAKPATPAQVQERTYGAGSHSPRNEATYDLNPLDPMAQRLS